MSAITKIANVETTTAIWEFDQSKEVIMEEFKELYEMDMQLVELDKSIDEVVKLLL
ncbi:hypothetical protein PAXRUDRAFT_21956 [Paxillus rubicundulus Ve08.2h10]|uniref:Uncharacterized protein n=1 Tax=Paxillus rubicundulus Ve08.2h10 TaxID=930991 RepID=A0A0D0D6H4_9AGAM|nr:hypothetical protein PAXRUDRAFT_21956 [Paxillus rubicundulus Ve08.2h10]